MKKDIPFPKVEDVALAAVMEEADGQEEWYVYIINLKDKPITTVLVSSAGHGEIDGRPRKTNDLRQMLGDIAPGGYMKIEMLTEELLEFSNEYWVSFYVDDMIYDRKYVFMPGSFSEKLFTTIPVINKKGILIR